MLRRNTTQKNIILNAVRSLKSHVTAEEVYNYIHTDSPSISKGTVYRNLNILADEGKIKKIEISSGAVYFDFTVTNHFHFKCKKCGRLFDILMVNEPNLLDYIKEDNNFSVLNYEIVFKGLCSNCKTEDL